MKILMLSKDKKLYNELMQYQTKISLPIELYSKSNNPVDIMSEVFASPPNILLLDDDFVQPETTHLLKSIRKVKGKLNIIFLTSNDSVEFGKEVIYSTVQYYAIKPISGFELTQSINSFLKPKTSQLH